VEGAATGEGEPYSTSARSSVGGVAKDREGGEKGGDPVRQHGPDLHKKSTETRGTIITNKKKTTHCRSATTHIRRCYSQKTRAKARRSDDPLSLQPSLQPSAAALGELQLKHRPQNTSSNPHQQPHKRARGEIGANCEEDRGEPHQIPTRLEGRHRHRKRSLRKKGAVVRRKRRPRNTSPHAHHQPNKKNKIKTRASCEEPYQIPIVSCEEDWDEPSQIFTSQRRRRRPRRRSLRGEKTSARRKHHHRDTSPKSYHQQKKSKSTTNYGEDREAPHQITTRIRTRGCNRRKNLKEQTCEAVTRSKSLREQEAAARSKSLRKQEDVTRRQPRSRNTSSTSYHQNKNKPGARASCGEDREALHQINAGLRSRGGNRRKNLIETICKAAARSKSLREQKATARSNSLREQEAVTRRQPRPQNTSPNSHNQSKSKSEVRASYGKDWEAPYQITTGLRNKGCNRRKNLREKTCEAAKRSKSLQEQEDVARRQQRSRNTSPTSHHQSKNKSGARASCGEDREALHQINTGLRSKGGNRRKNLIETTCEARDPVNSEVHKSRGT
jgi:hypothetical protein